MASPTTPNEVLRGDFARVLAEFWADGPESETPPGHWNTIANEVSRHARTSSSASAATGRWSTGSSGTSSCTSRSTARSTTRPWRRGASRGHYDSVRPISMIRYLGGKGQSSDPAGPAYDPDGLPAGRRARRGGRPRESSASGQRHEALAEHVGEVAIKAWRGQPRGPRPRPVASGGSWPSIGSPTSGRRS